MPPCMPAMNAATLRRSMAALAAARYSWPGCCSLCRAGTEPQTQCPMSLSMHCSCNERQRKPSIRQHTQAPACLTWSCARSAPHDISSSAITMCCLQGDQAVLRCTVLGTGTLMHRALLIPKASASPPPSAAAPTSEHVAGGRQAAHLQSQA